MHKDVEKKDVTYSVHHYISGIPFPATAKDILDYARNKGADNGVVTLLEKLPQEDYKNESHVLETIVKIKK